MGKIFFAVSLLFLGCSFKGEEVKNFAKCYINKVPAPFWVCYENSFIGIGKLHTESVNRLKQEEANSIAINNLIKKLVSKTEEFSKRLNKRINIQDIKSYVIVNSIDDGYWFDKNNHILYSKVVIDKKKFKKFLFDRFKNIDQNKLKIVFDEVF